MLLSAAQIQYVIDHTRKQKRAWESIREASEKIAALNGAMPGDECRALYGVCNETGAVDLLLAGIQDLAETKIAEVDASLHLHEKLQQQAGSNILVPEFGRPT